MRCSVCGRPFSGDPARGLVPTRAYVILHTVAHYVGSYLGATVVEPVCWDCKTWWQLKGYVMPARRH